MLDFSWAGRPAASLEISRARLASPPSPSHKSLHVPLLRTECLEFGHQSRGLGFTTL